MNMEGPPPIALSDHYSNAIHYQKWNFVDYQNWHLRQHNPPSSEGICISNLTAVYSNFELFPFNVSHFNVRHICSHYYNCQRHVRSEDLEKSNKLNELTTSTTKKESEDTSSLDEEELFNRLCAATVGLEDSFGFGNRCSLRSIEIKYKMKDKLKMTMLRTS